MDNTEPYLGARNTQTQAQVAKNYTLDEVCASPAPVIWIEKLQDNWRHFPIRDQDGSFQCVCMTLATEMGIIFNEKYDKWIDFSSSFPYQQRKYPGQGGCTSEDIYDVFPKLGNIYESFMPSQKLSETQASLVPRENYYTDLAKVYQIARIALPLEFETIASTIQATGKGVMVWFKFNPSEWTDIPTLGTLPPTSGHSVTAVDFTLLKGKKYLIIQDSWGLGYAIHGLRLISEEYFYERCYQAGYLKTFEIQNNNLVPVRPIFDGSIISFQMCMKWLGFFPANITPVENYGNISRSACVKYQLARGITPALGNLGPITRAKLAEEFK